MQSDTLILGVDLDGVCADYTTAFRPLVAQELNIPLSSLPEERSWDFSEWGLSPKQFQDLHHKAVEDYRMFRSMPVFENASEVLWRLSDAGVWIRIITHRLYVNWGHAVAVTDTVEWLDQARIPYRDICFLGDKPEVEADIYLEDAPHNIASLRSSGNSVIVFDAPYNQEVDGLRATSWLNCEQMILDLAAEMGFEIQPELPGLEVSDARLIED
ncbi:MAG: hypothetical protein MB54_03475 [marine actinobacterium MedAcidi-G2B]|nr:MAG: hypothetical protein MB54_03475 [marine actinobacterium MedAcidi-G2B]|tara:strand:- start:1890 stop:2531 length:642 start_codon:yes stop_codon:yes gene_type:complete